MFPPPAGSDFPGCRQRRSWGEPDDSGLARAGLEGRSREFPGSGSPARCERLLRV